MGEAGGATALSDGDTEPDGTSTAGGGSLTGLNLADDDDEGTGRRAASLTTICCVWGGDCVCGACCSASWLL